jgi:uncharacterized LabA/DUF88 family protein
MPAEPKSKRVVAFIDGQNLFYAAAKSFGYTFPNFDPRLLAEAVASRFPDWVLAQVRFYTGIHDPKVNPFWHHFWTAKLGAMGHNGVHTCSRQLRYSRETVALPDGTQKSVRVGHEKGIDLRIGLDLVRLVREDELDVALVFSQDQDLQEAVEEARSIAHSQNRWFKPASAFPNSPTSTSPRGIDRTDWIKVDKATYDQCLDPADYRPKKS